MNASVSVSQQVLFLSAHTFIVLPAPPLPLSRPQFWLHCEVMLSRTFHTDFVVRHDDVQVSLLMMHALKDLSGICMVCMILPVCRAFSVENFHFCSELYRI